MYKEDGGKPHKTKHNKQHATCAGRRLSHCTLSPLALYRYRDWRSSSASQCRTAVKTTVSGTALLNSVLPRTAFNRASVRTALLLRRLFGGVLLQAGICDLPSHLELRWTGQEPQEGDQGSTTAPLLCGTPMTNGGCARLLPCLVGFCASTRAGNQPTYV